MSLYRTLIGVICGFAAGAILTSLLLAGTHWAIGGLFGAFVGWVAVDPVAFFVGIKDAFAATIRKYQQRPQWTKLQRDHRFWYIAEMAAMQQSIIVWFGIPFSYFTFTVAVDGITPLEITLYMIGTLNVVFLMMNTSLFFSAPRHEGEEWMQKSIAERKQIVREWNPIVAPVSFVRLVWRSRHAVIHFVQGVWDRTVSDARLIAAIGASAGLAAAHFGGGNAVAHALGLGFGLLLATGFHVGYRRRPVKVKND
ncbi:MAG TPA: hypothetical protein VEB18_01470 [Candidatus Paceibacterota bacterium]|nr:hypothetical protein [Candidatus Paceibacterota bacterium]